MIDPLRSSGTGTGTGDRPPDDEEVRWRAARQLRRERPGWLIIWVARTAHFHAYPLSSRRSITLTAQTTGELALMIDQAGQAVSRHQAGLRPGPTGNPDSETPGPLSP